MEITQFIVRPFSIGRELATRRIIRQFAHKYDLVYFGHVSQREDAHEVIRGVTASATHDDSHFCVGTVRKHDVSLVDRRNTITFPEKPSRQYRWLIMQIDLRRDGLPHIFIDAHHHDVLFYETLFIKFSNLSNAAALFMEREPLFAKAFTTYTPADQFENVEQLLTHDTTAMLAHHFRQFDYEIDGDRLLVYASNAAAITPHVLQEMLRVGLWFAEQLDNKS